MNKTESNNIPLSEKTAWTVEELKQGLSCGRASAIKIGTAAGARLQIGRRVLWDAEKVRAYIRNMSR